MTSGTRPRRPGGFTLVELLVVITIILLVSVATIPVVMPALGARRVSEAARILQAALVGARDAAIHYDEPRGIRLLPDPDLTDPPLGSTQVVGGVTVPTAGTSRLAFNRFVPIEPAPDYAEGAVSIHSDLSQPLSSPSQGTNNWADPATPGFPPVGYLMVWEASWTGIPGNPGVFVNAPTSWFWNIRVGDKFQFKNSGRVYTIIGPQVIGAGSSGNPEGFVNIGPPGTSPPNDQFYNLASATTFRTPEFLYLVNGVDDDNDGYIDDGWDGIDNNLANGVDEPAEMESETWLGSDKLRFFNNSTYVINRRPTVSQGARETFLPGGTVVDATTWNFPNPERSRLPFQPGTSLTIDVMVQPGGQVQPSSFYSNPASFGLGAAFYHFWLCDREDVQAPVDQSTNNVPYLLPMPADAIGYPNANDTVWKLTNLRGQRRLLTLFTRTGNIVTNEIENAALIDPANRVYSAGFIANTSLPTVQANQAFNANNPFIEAQLGVREAR